VGKNIGRALSNKERISSMKKENKIYGKPKKAHSLDHLKNAIDHTHPASVNDCTGYTPVIPLWAEEAEAYEELMDVPATARYLHRSEDDL
jgi:hypothetical protein